MEPGGQIGYCQSDWARNVPVVTRCIMRIKPNKTLLEGKVNRVDRAPDGWGANVEFQVDNSAPAAGFSDFLQAKPGSVVTIFSAEPDAVQAGKAYKLTTSVLGGPRGERVVIEDAQPKTR